jgi:DNA-binding SARP family transcriptional activator
MEQPISIKLLCGPRICYGDRALSGAHMQRPDRLSAYLATNRRRVVSREEAIGALQSESDRNTVAV